MAENRPLKFLVAVLGILGAAALLVVVMVRNRRAEEVSPSAADDVVESSPALLPPKPELVEAAESEDDSEPKEGDSGGDAGAGASMDADDMRGFIAGLVRPWDPGEPVERGGVTAPIPELVMGLPEKRPAPGWVGDGEPDDDSLSAPLPREAVVQDRPVPGRKEDGGGADSAPGEGPEAAEEASVSGELSGAGAGDSAIRAAADSEVEASVRSDGAPAPAGSDLPSDAAEGAPLVVDAAPAVSDFPFDSAEAAAAAAVPEEALIEGEPESSGSSPGDGAAGAAPVPQAPASSESETPGAVMAAASEGAGDSAMRAAADSEVEASVRSDGAPAPAGSDLPSDAAEGAPLVVDAAPAVSDFPFDSAEAAAAAAVPEEALIEGEPESSGSSPGDGAAGAETVLAPPPESEVPELVRDPVEEGTESAPVLVREPPEVGTESAPELVRDPVEVGTESAPELVREPPEVGTESASELVRDPVDSGTESAPVLVREPVEVGTESASELVRDPVEVGTESAPVLVREPSEEGTKRASELVRDPVDSGTESAPVFVREPPEVGTESAPELVRDPVEVGTESAPVLVRDPADSGIDARVTADTAPAARVLPDAEADTAVRVVGAAADDAAASGATAAGSAPGFPAAADPAAAEFEMPELAQAGSEISGAGAGGTDAPGEAVSEAVSIGGEAESPAVPEDVPADTVPRGTGAGWRERIARASESGGPRDDAGSEEAGAAAGAAPGVEGIGDGGTVETAADAAAPVLSAAGVSTPAGAAPATARVLVGEGAGGPPDSGEAAPGADAESDEPLSAGDLVILSPAEGSFYSSEVTVRGEAPGFTELAWRSEALGIGGEIPLDGQAGFEFTAAAFGFNGELDITVSGRDAEGELRGSLIQLINDGIGPSIELVSPLAGDYFTDYVEVTGRLAGGAGEASNTGEAESLSWSVDDGEFRSAIFGPGGDFAFQASMPRYDGTEDERPLSAELILLARDLNGNASERRIQLTDGRLTPGLVVTGPIDDSEYGAGFSLQGRVSDPYAGLEGGEGGIQSVRYEILSPDSATRAGIVTGEISIAPDGSFDFPVFTGELSGDQDISVIVTGNNGRRTIETLRLRQGISSIPDFTVRSGDSVVNVSWSAIPAAGEYAVNVSDSTGDPVRYIVSGASAELGGLLNGLEYSFQLEAALPSGVVESHSVNAIPLAPDTLQPDVIGEFRRIRVNWDDIPGSDFYAVFRAEAEDGPYVLTAQAVPGDEFIDTQVQFGRRYWYAVAPADYIESVSAPSSAETLSVQASSIELLARLETAGADSIHIEGEYAFAASRDAGLVLVDIAEAVRPVSLSRTEIVNALDVAVRGAYAYVAAGRSGLNVVNIDDPANPVLVGSEPAGNAVGVDVSGSYAYVADLEGGLRVLDVSSSREPKRLVVAGGLEGRDVRVAGNLAYLAAGDGIHIYDVSVPASPRQLRTIELDGAERILLSEGLLIAGGLESGVYIYDAGSPGEPSLLSRIPELRAAQLDVSQGFLLAGTPEELILVDLRDSAAPTVLETYSIPNAEAMAIAGDKLLISEEGGINFYQTHLLGNAFVTGSLDTEGRSYNVSSFGENVYVASHSGGVTVVDSAGLETRAVHDTEFARAAAADSNNIYVADGYAGVRVIRGENQGDIIFEGNGFVNDVAVIGETVYAASEEGLVVISTADGAVRRLGTMNVQASRTLAADGSLLFAGGGDTLGLFVPIPGEMPFEASAVRVDGIRDAAAGNNVAAAVSERGVSLFQYDSFERRMDPAGEIAVDNAESVTINDGYLYISAGYRGLLIYDIRDIESPKLISVGTDMFAVDTTVIEGTPFLVDGDGLKSLSLFIPPWLR